MFTSLTLLLAPLLAFALPQGIANPRILERTDNIGKRSSPLSCVTYMWNGPFASTGADGFVHLYSNITEYDSETQTTSFVQTRLGLVNGTIQPCGECRTTEQFGFEVCEGPDRKGYVGLPNSPNFFYGHLLYRNVDTPRCVSASRNAGSLDGVSLNVADCKYDYDTVKTNGQYWKMSRSDEGYFIAQLQYASAFEDSYYGETYGPNENGTALQKDIEGKFAFYGFESAF